MSRIVYLECRENNHDKFYLMTEYSAGTTFVARWWTYRHRRQLSHVLNVRLAQNAE